MAKRHSNAQWFFLLAACGVLSAACSSSDDRSLVILDLQLGTGVPAPASVRLRALRDGNEVKTADFAWEETGDRLMQVGLFIPAGVAGPVTVAAEASNGDGLVATGKVEAVSLKVGGTVGPWPLTLDALVTPPAPDGGVDADVLEVGVPGAEVKDGPPSTGTDGPIVDGTASEVGAAEVIPPDIRTVDVTQPDAGAKDVPSFADAADTTVTPADGPATPVDTIPGGEAGVHTPAWEPAQNVENDLLNSSYSPVILVEPVNEHVYVAWAEASAIKVKRWNRLSAAWEKTITVETRGDPNGPALGADGRGNVLLVWAQNTGGDNPSVDGVWVSRTSDGLAWSPAARISPDAAFGVRLAVARNGTAHAVYSKQTSSGWPLFTAYYDGTGWTENSTTLDPNQSYGDSETRVAVGGTGDGLVTFRQNWGVMGAALTGPTFSPPIMLDPNYEDVSANDSAMAVNRKGEGIVIWSEASGSNDVLLARTYTPGASAGFSNVLPPITTASMVQSAAVALDEQGNATIVWQQYLATGGANFVGIHGSPAGSWSDVTVLETDNVAGYLTGEFGFPKMAIDASGNVLMVWRKDLSTATTTTYGAYATRFAGGSWLPQVELGRKTGQDVWGLDVSVADSGFGAATFIYLSDTDPQSYNVHVAFFR